VTGTDIKKPTLTIDIFYVSSNKYLFVNKRKIFDSHSTTMYFSRYHTFFSKFGEVRRTTYCDVALCLVCPSPQPKMGGSASIVFLCSRMTRSGWWIVDLGERRSRTLAPAPVLGMSE
jgi:hypothetical protein